ncbi:MAG: hypothetical protein LBH34_04705, partial [Prevotellaceae bacterium]|nr:hypothetical protein [Prevotellaceae bacterium]
KIDNITVGYTVPIKTNRYLRSLRIYATGQNLLTITGYSGIDPEVDVTNVWSAGIDYPDFYPNVMNFMLGVSITLN